MKVIDCYVVSRERRPHDSHPVRVFTSKEKAREYKNLQQDISGERFYIDTVNLEINDDEEQVP